MEDNKFNIFWMFWFLICAATAVAVLGVGIWAIIELVQWVTAQ